MHLPKTNNNFGIVDPQNLPVTQELQMYYNQNLDKKTTKKILSWFLDNYGPSRTSAFLEELKSVGFHYATEAGISLGFDDLKIPPRKNFILDQAEKQISHTERFYRHGRMTAIERYQAVIDIWTTASEKLKEEVIAHFQLTDLFNPLYMMAFSGARGNISQVRQLVGMRGLMSDSAGGIIDFPIRKNFREGLTITEYVISCYGARKGLIDTALRTADSGYLTRRLVDVAHGIMIGTMDCGTKEAFTIYALKAPDSNQVMQSLEKRILGRVCAKTNEEISPALAYEIIRRKDNTIPKRSSFLKPKLRSSLDIRSPLTCQTSRMNGGHTEDICQLCYGWSLAHGRLVSLGEAVGILAAQSIGEPGTQLTMRTFHTGGIFAGGTDAKLFAPHDGIISFANMADLVEGKGRGFAELRSGRGEAHAQASPLLTPARLPQGKKIRTSLGQTAFFSFEKIQLKITRSKEVEFTSAAGELRSAKPTPALQSSKVLAREESYLSIPAYSLLFVYPGQKIEKNSLCAEISYLMQAKASLGENSALGEGYTQASFGGAQAQLRSAKPMQSRGSSARQSPSAHAQASQSGATLTQASPYLLEGRSARVDLTQSSQDSTETRTSGTNETPTMTKKVLSDIEGQVYFHRIAERRQKTGVEDIRHVKGVGSLWILNGSLRSTKGNSQCGDFFLGRGEIYNARSNVANQNSKTSLHINFKAYAQASPLRSFAEAKPTGSETVASETVQASCGSGASQRPNRGEADVRFAAGLREARAMSEQGRSPRYQSGAQASQSGATLTPMLAHDTQIPNAYTGQRKLRLLELNNRHDDIFAFQKSKNRIRSSQGLLMCKTKFSFGRNFRGQSLPPLQGQSPRHAYPESRLRLGFPAEAQLRSREVRGLRQSVAAPTHSLYGSYLSGMRGSIKSNNFFVFSVFWSSRIINKQSAGKGSIALQNLHSEAGSALSRAFVSFAIRAHANRDNTYARARECFALPRVGNIGINRGEARATLDRRNGFAAGQRLRYSREALQKISLYPVRSNYNLSLQVFAPSNCELRGKYISEINKVPEEIDIFGLEGSQSLVAQLGSELVQTSQSIAQASPLPCYEDALRSSDFQSLDYQNKGSASNENTSRITATRSNYMNSISLHKKHLRQYWIAPSKPSENCETLQRRNLGLGNGAGQGKVYEERSAGFAERSYTKANFRSAAGATAKKEISVTETSIDALPKLGEALRYDSLAQVIVKVLSCRNVSPLWKCGAPRSREVKQSLLKKSLQQLRPRKAIQVIIRKIHPYVLSNEAALLVHQGEGVSRRQILCELFFEKSKTGDIVQGLPKIEQLFEARRTSTHVQNAIHLRLKSHFFEACKLYSQVEAARQAIRSIQRILVDEIQMVYQSQGVDISDKHIEIIVRQMTSKVIILDSAGGLSSPSAREDFSERRSLVAQISVATQSRDEARAIPIQSGATLTPVFGQSDSRGLNDSSRSLPFYADDIIEYRDVLKTLTSAVHTLESDLLGNIASDAEQSRTRNNRCSPSPEFEPIVLGITKRAFLSESWASSASFQEAKKVLMESACESKIDFLSGLKSNLIVGRYIRAGTSFQR